MIFQEKVLLFHFPYVILCSHSCYTKRGVTAFCAFLCQKSNNVENGSLDIFSCSSKHSKNQQGRTPAYNFVTNILKNRRYLGEYSFKDTVVENVFSGIGFA